MSDVYEVETALAILSQMAIYPNGTSEPSVAGCDVRIYPGWPIPANLEADLKAGKANVSIFPTNIVRSTTRFDIAEQTVSINDATLTLTVNNAMTQVIVGGAISVPQSCMVIVNGNGYAYTVQENDTLATIAAGIAARIPGATSDDATVIINNPCWRLIARVGVTGVSAQEFGREDRVFMITVWAPTPTIRYQLGNALLVMFGKTFRIGMPDGFFASLKFKGTHEVDMLQKAQCYRRDINFAVEYAITESGTNYTITNSFANLSPSPYPQLLLVDGEFLVLLNGEQFSLFGN
jgi:hypothetical protein